MRRQWYTLLVLGFLLVGCSNYSKIRYKKVKSHAVEKEHHSERLETKVEFNSDVEPAVNSATQSNAQDDESISIPSELTEINSDEIVNSEEQFRVEKEVETQCSVDVKAEKFYPGPNGPKSRRRSGETLIGVLCVIGMIGGCLIPLGLLLLITPLFEIGILLLRIGFYMFLIPMPLVIIISLFTIS